MVIDTGGVITLSKSQAGVMEELAVTTTVGMDGIPLATREAAIARMPSMIEKQAVAAVDEADVVLFVVDGQAGSASYFLNFIILFSGLFCSLGTVTYWFGT
jgi:predicted GTPase